MRKIITVFLFAILLSPSHSYGGDTLKSLVHMPAGYTYTETKDFIQSIVTDKFKNGIYATFPEINKQQRGGFRFAPAFTQSFNGKGRGNAVLIKCYGFGDWSNKESYFNFLVDYVQKKVGDLTEKQYNTNH